MAKKPNVYGGGAKTNENGLKFEQTTSLNEALKNAGFEIRDTNVFKDNSQVGKSVPKNKLYSDFLEPNNIDYKQYNSKQWLPDECFINNEKKTVYIIEKKFQNTAGSVDEKLPNCHFKKKEYEKLLAPLGYNVEYLYVFNDWFKDSKYKDTLEYIKTMGCHYFYNDIPLTFMGLTKEEEQADDT